MREVLPELMSWYQDGHEAALATVVATYESAPRLAGAAMLRGPGDVAVGSVSGGCVEGAVFELCGDVIATGTPTLQRYGVSDDTAGAIGLTCGGVLDIFIEPVSAETFPQLAGVAADVDAGRPVAVATIVKHPNPDLVGRRLVVRPDQPVQGGSGCDRIDAAIYDDAIGLLAAGRNASLTYGPDGQRRGEGMTVFVASFVPAPRLLVLVQSTLPSRLLESATCSIIWSQCVTRVGLLRHRRVFRPPTT